jgi:MerR family transcriptional activator of bmr gene
MKDLYSIGQVSGICGISVQGLRYYDKIGLLKPSVIDESSGYRYYSNRDIRNIKIIQDMKEMGFTLEEIQKLVMSQDMSPVIGALEKKKEEYEERIRNHRETLQRISDRLENLSHHFSRIPQRGFEETIEVKRLPERIVAFSRYYSDCLHETLVKRFYELDNIVRKGGYSVLGYRMAIYHDFLDVDFNPDHCDLEVCVTISPENGLYPSGVSDVRAIEQGLYVTAIYHGAYQGQCHALADWAAGNGYEITGPGVEIYINSFMNTKFPKNYITEVQFPVRRK